MRHGRERCTPAALPRPLPPTSLHACQFRPGPILASRPGSFLASAEVAATGREDCNVSRSARTVFYSWQSDLPNAVNRGMIGDSLDRAVKAISTAGAETSCTVMVDLEPTGEAFGAPERGRALVGPERFCPPTH
jgi:hypothetical protein